MIDNLIKIRTIKQWYKTYNLKIPADFKGSQYELVIDRCRSYLQWLNDHPDGKPQANPYVENHRIYYPFEHLLYMTALESVHYDEMKAARDGLDIMKDINFKIFQPLTEDDDINASIIGKAFGWLQEYRNRIRNVFILLDIHLPELMRSTYTCL